MKMNMGKRLVLILHWVLSAVACLMVLFFCVWPDVICRGFEFLYSLIGKRSADIFGAVVLGVYVILAVLSIAFLLQKKQKDNENGFITVISDETGRTRIAVGAIDQMIRIAVRGIEGIADIKTAITNETDAIAINVNVAVLSGVHIPTVTMNIKRTISSYIELNCGVSVREVSVSVNALETPEDTNKRGRKKLGKPSQAVAAPVPAMEPAPAVMESAIVPEPVAETAAEVASETESAAAEYGADAE